MTYFKDSAKIWRNEQSLLHREDGPAVIWPDGYEEWYINGKRHRLDGPAIVGSNTTSYWIDGKIVASSLYHLFIIMHTLKCNINVASTIAEIIKDGIPAAE